VEFVIVVQLETCIVCVDQKCSLTTDFIFGWKEDKITNELFYAFIELVIVILNEHFFYNIHY